MTEIERIPIIASGIASGLSQEVIAKSIDVSPSTVSRRARQPEVRALIEQAKQKMIGEYLPRSVENIGHAINRFQELKPGEDNQLRYLGYRASEKMLENIGILGTPSVQFNTMISAGITILHPMIKELLHSGSEDIIDLEID